MGTDGFSFHSVRGEDGGPLRARVNVFDEKAVQPSRTIRGRLLTGLARANLMAPPALVPLHGDAAGGFRILVRRHDAALV
jgi:hypothetical protein